MMQVAKSFGAGALPKEEMPMRRLTLLLLICALAALGLASCGGDDDGGTDTAATTPTETTTPEEGGGGGPTRTVDVTAEPGGDLAYVQDSLTARAGSNRFVLTNDSSVPHDVNIEQDGEDLGGTEVITGDTADVTLDLEPGRYTYYCSVPGHREAGMEGTLTVR